LCPIGWHVPSDTEWTTLSTYLGGLSEAGGKLKSLAGWYSPNSNATNSTGFSALAGGMRDFSDGMFQYASYDGYWWTATEYDARHAWIRSISYSSNQMYRSGISTVKSHGFSVRCVKD
jgi:uncharacterized protein (TIGR02145 family)